jgi:pimeloyl-ACP methyl ester carboxylesterase
MLPRTSITRSPVRPSIVVTIAIIVGALLAPGAASARTPKTPKKRAVVVKKKRKPVQKQKTTAPTTLPAATVPPTAPSSLPPIVATDPAALSVATTPPVTAPPAPPVPPAVFGRCPSSGLECADVSVPLNPKDPAGERVTLFVSRRRATGPAPRIGVLFVNPGGPGGPTYDLVRSANTFLTPEVLSRFDVVGVDPRGTSRSAELRCGTGLFQPEYTSEKQSYFDGFAKTCSQTDGDRLQYLDTETAARDLEAVRTSLGEEQISFLGMSYGTYLGSVYRSLFPTRVRSMILDSAVDPSRFGVNQLLDRAVASEAALDGFLDECASGRLAPCNFNDGTDLRAKYVRVRDDYVAKFPRGRLSGEDTFDSTIAELVGYPRNGWPIMGRALQELATTGRANFNQIAADSKSTDDSERVRPLDTFSIATNLAINCRDGLLPREPGSYQFIYDQTSIRAPRFSGLRDDADFAYTCVNWPAPLATRVPLGPQSAPALVIGNTYDLTTPYTWSQGLAATLGVPLLTRNGGGHVAVTKSPCIREAAARFLIDITAPPTGTVCSPSLSNPS